MKDVVQKIRELNIGKIEESVSIAKHTTYRVGGIAAGMAYPRNVACLVKLIRFLKMENVSYKVIGNGSNLLFSDSYYNGILIRLSEIDSIEFFGHNKVRVGAGYSLMKLCTVAARKGYTGLEFASGIPGSVGGSVFMNAGAYKSDMGYVVERVKVLTPDLKIIYLENKEMNFHYRTSFLQKHPDYICLEVVLQLHKGRRDAIEAVMRERRMRRMDSQPLEYPSAGSVFRNPEGNFAGKLIEDVGLKGTRVGGAMISEKHANFVVNYKNATGSDIKALIDMAHEKVYNTYGIDLKIEQELVNWE